MRKGPPMGANKHASCPVLRALFGRKNSYIHNVHLDCTCWSLGVKSFLSRQVRASSLIALVQFIQFARLVAHVQVCVAVSNFHQDGGLLKLMVGDWDAKEELNRELEVGDVLH